MSPGEGQGLSAQLAADFQAYRSGDVAAMADLVRRVTPLLWHLARGYRLPAASAEDVVQNTLLALVSHADTIVDPAATLSWLVVTARRDAARLARSERRSEPVAELAVGVPDTEAVRPEAQVLAEAERSVLWRHFAKLSERCRLLLRVIAFAERPDYATIAEQLGMPIGSIGPTRGRCLAKLRAMLDADREWELA